MRLRAAPVASGFVLALASIVRSQDAVDLGVVDRIKAEAFGRSEVMDHLHYLTDVHGPRLTGSAGFEDAAKWTTGRLAQFGLSNIHIERWPFGRRWSADQYSLELLEPHYMRLAAVPLAWSDSTSGAVTGEPLLAPFELAFIRGPKRIAEDFDAYRRKWTGKLRGRIVLFTPVQRVAPREEALFKRRSEADLAKLATAPEPARMLRVTRLDDLEWPESESELDALFNGMSSDLLDQLFDRLDAITAERSRFLRDEGVAAVLQSDGRAREGLLAGEAAGSYHARDPLAPPTLVVTAEHYNRLIRLVEGKTPPRIRVEVKTTASAADVESGNIVAEIPGTGKPDEVVMIGAHFDSWHSGTGATDNGAGSAVMIEVMRVLKALNLRMERTVRIALWGGEEQGLLGSLEYVKAHFADPKTMALKPEYAKLSGYFNLDNGSGRIRGVYLQEHDAMRPLFEQWLAPFHDLGVTTISIHNTGGTDHLSFARVGLPGFQFIQDQLAYGTVTHHTSADTYDEAIPADLMQASAVIATVVYEAANRPERLPRREPPRPAK
jgi:carboxypeptidase Q